MREIQAPAVPPAVPNDGIRDDSTDDTLELDLGFTDDDNATSASNRQISPSSPFSDQMQVVETPQGRGVIDRWYSRLEFIHDACNQWTTLPLAGGNHDIHDLILRYWGDANERL